MVPFRLPALSASGMLIRMEGGISATAGGAFLLRLSEGNPVCFISVVLKSFMCIHKRFYIRVFSI